MITNISYININSLDTGSATSFFHNLPKQERVCWMNFLQGKSKAIPQPSIQNHSISLEQCGDGLITKIFKRFLSIFVRISSKKLVSCLKSWQQTNKTLSFQKECEALLGSDFSQLNTLEKLKHNRLREKIFDDSTITIKDGKPSSQPDMNKLLQNGKMFFLVSINGQTTTITNFFDFSRRESSDDLWESDILPKIPESGTFYLLCVDDIFNEFKAVEKLSPTFVGKTHGSEFPRVTCKDLSTDQERQVAKIIRADRGSVVRESKTLKIEQKSDLTKALSESHQQTFFDCVEIHNTCQIHTLSILALFGEIKFKQCLFFEKAEEEQPGARLKQSQHLSKLFSTLEQLPDISESCYM